MTQLQGCRGLPAAPRLREAEKESPLEPSEGEGPCQHLELLVLKNQQQESKFLLFEVTQFG